MRAETEALFSFIQNKQHHIYRHRVDWDLATEYADQGLSPMERMADRFSRLCREEQPVILPGEQITFLRTVANLPEDVAMAYSDVVEPIFEGVRYV